MVHLPALILAQVSAHFVRKFRVDLRFEKGSWREFPNMVAHVRIVANTCRPRCQNRRSDLAEFEVLENRIVLS